MSRDDHRAAYLAWLSVCFIWGTTYLAIRVALETIPPFLLGGLRFVAAGGVLAAILAARGVRLPQLRQWPGFALMGFLMLTVCNGGVVWAEQWVASGLAAVVIAACPFWMVGIETLLPGGESLRRRAVVGLVVGFAGILMLVWPDLNAGGEWGRNFTVGVIALQIACVGWALGSSYSKRHSRGENALGAATMQMIFGGVFLLIAATARGEWSELHFTTRTAAAEVYLVVFGSLVAYSAYVFALKHLPVSTVSLYAYVNPVIAVILGTLLLDEPFGWRVVISSAVVFGGVAIVRWKGVGMATPASRSRAAA